MWSTLEIDVPFSLRTAALSIAAMWMLSGCGLVNSFQDPPEESAQNNDDENDNDTDLNACGGQEELQFDGSPAEPGDACGPCERDTLQCEGEEQLTCSPGDTACEGPSNLATTPHVEHVLVEWDHVDGADAYRIYRDGELLETIDADSGDGMHAYEDAGATAIVPEQTDVEASQGERPDGIELTWTPVDDPDDDDPTDIPDGYQLTEHEYSVVAEHHDFESGDSEPVELSGHRRADAIDSYEFRVLSENEPQWIEASIQQTIDDKAIYVHSTDAGAKIPEVEFDTLTATEGELDDEIALEISEASGLWTSTEYEFRAVTESGIEGDTSNPSGHVSAEELHVEWQRAESEGGNFDEIDNSTFELDEDADNQRYTAQNSVSTTDTPGTPDAYYYRAELRFDDHDDSVVTDDHRGFLGYPPLYSASDDQSVRRIHPVGEEAWEWEFDTIISPSNEIKDVTTSPEGAVYVSTGGGEIVKLDDDGNDEWTFAEHDEIVDDISIGPDEEYLYSASVDGSVYQIDTDSGDEINEWTSDEEHYSVAVEDTDAVYVASGALSTNATAGIFKLDFSEDEVDQQWQHETLNDATAVAVDDDGDVYWGSFNQDLEQLDAGDGSVQETYDLPQSAGSFVTDIAVDDQDRLYAGGEDADSNGFLWQYDVDQNDPIDTVDAIPTQVTGLDVGPDGHVYYSLGSEESVHKLDENLDEAWVFEEHGDVVQSVAIAPGVYGTFPSAWDDD